MNEFAELLALRGVTQDRGASGPEFEVFEAQTGLKLPPELRRLYEYSNGLVIDHHRRGWMRVHTLDEVADFAFNLGTFGIPAAWGYFPFTDRNDSNPYCVCCAGPVTGYVVRVNHDDVACIEFRSVRSLFSSVRRVIDGAGELDGRGGMRSLQNLPQDFYPTTSDRTPDDIETARLLLAFAATLDEGSVERADAERWAITLFSENEVKEIAHLLDTGDEYRREEAVAKLSQVASAQARDAVQRHRREMSQFSRQAVDALRHAGLNVAEVKNGRPRVEPGCVWLNIEMFFTQRRRPTIFADIVRRARELIALKTQGK